MPEGAADAFHVAHPHTNDILGWLDKKDIFFLSDIAGMARGLVAGISWFTIIAILREPEPVTGAQPDDVIQEGDTLELTDGATLAVIASQGGPHL